MPSSDKRSKPIDLTPTPKYPSPEDTRMLHVTLSTSLVMVAAVAGGVARIAAQQPTMIDPGMAALPPREVDRIEAELGLARADLRAAEAEKTAADERRSRTQGEVEVKKREISTLDARMKLADKTKNESEKASLAAEKRVGEREKALLERRADLHKTEAESADKRRALADASRRALETELKLARRRGERSRVTVVGPQMSHLDQVIRELEGKVLEAQRDRAQATAEVAEKEEQLVERRIAIFRAQAAK